MRSERTRSSPSGISNLLCSRYHLIALLAIGVVLFLACSTLNPLAAEPKDPTKQQKINDHWSFKPIVLPKISGIDLGPRIAAEVRNPIDVFVGAHLSKRGLEFSKPADRATLIRRIYYVMLGIPPTPEEVFQFMRRPEPTSLESLIEQVLADSRYGERWGRHWLDVIRFAESNGFETNRERLTAWRFRDYVIQSLNQDKPYDLFIREQLAGDQLGMGVGTGFLVGGPVDIVKSPDITLTAQQRADEIDDMVSTTATAFLGLTVGCARCHSHKFDPISQREYYSVAGIFAGVQHGERSLPLSQEAQIRAIEIQKRISDLDQMLQPFIQKASSKTNQPEVLSVSPSKLPAIVPTVNEDRISPVLTRYLRFQILDTNHGEPCLDELEVWADGKNVALSNYGTKVTSSGDLSGYEIHQLKHINDGLYGNSRSWISNEAGKGSITYEFPTDVKIDRILWGRDRKGVFTDRVPIKYRIEVASSSGVWTVVASSDKRKAGLRSGFSRPNREYQLKQLSDPQKTEVARWIQTIKDLDVELTQVTKPSTIYAGTFVEPGPVHRFHRGDPLQKLEEVNPATLNVFEPIEFSSNTPEKERRLRFANWVIDPSNPLTARVIVNRIWQHHFGIGMVDTPNDFGRSGGKPTHPELLDWLASELISNRWSIKHLHRLILSSATWRQSSVPRSEGMSKDAATRFLWRFPPRRIEAETVRDTILSVSGNLNLRLGGPSFYLHEVDRENVYHYHPKEVFGPAEFRRMVYAFKVRMEQDGIFGAFDCPDGSLVMPRRSISTTPLQALNLFNSQFILDQSEIFSRRLIRERPDGLQSQIEYAWQLAYGRKLGSEESQEALRLARDHGLAALCRSLLNSNELLFIP